MTIPVSCRSVNRDDALITRFMTGSSPYSPYRTPEGCRGRIPGVPGSTEAEVPRYLPVETSHPQRKSGFPKPPVPRPSPCGTPLSPPLPRPAASVQHQEWSAVCRSAWLRGARAEPWVWRGRRQVALGASGGTLPGRSRKKAVCFSYPHCAQLSFPLPSLSRRGREA